MVRAARKLLSAITKVLLIADKVIVKQLLASKDKVSYYVPRTEVGGDILGNLPHRATTGRSAIMANCWRAGGGPQLCASWDISFDANPICVTFFPAPSLLNQSVGFDQTCIDTLLGGGKEMISFWLPLSYNST